MQSRRLNSKKTMKSLIWIWKRILSPLKVNFLTSNFTNFVSTIQRFCLTEEDDDVMKHPDAETLDICMVKLFDFIKNEHEKENKNVTITKTFKLLIHCFVKLVLPVHNSHHVQFMIFYYCSFKVNQFIYLKFTPLAILICVF